MRVIVVVGTRPEIIKMSPVVRELIQRRVPFGLVHTKQHYSYELDAIFFRQLDMPEPDHELEAGSGTHAEQISRILVGMERLLLKDRCDYVLVQGDTNTVLGAVLAAVKTGVKIGHVEAGLRCGDMGMPEEQNRKVADCLSSLLFAPTKHAARNLVAEGIRQDSIFVTGNTIVDALLHCKGQIPPRTQLLASLEIGDEPYLLLTLHRAGNVDNEEVFGLMLQGLKKLGRHSGTPIIWPIHPRAQNMLNRSGFNLGDCIRVIPSVGYFEFLGLISYARLILTDSGGVQEEACVLRVPCITLRENTERPETLEVGSNVLAGSNVDRILAAADQMLHRPRAWDNPFGDGDAGKRIVEILVNSS